MKKNFGPQIEMLFGLGIQDIEQTGDVLIRELSIKDDGAEELFPPSGTIGVSLNLHSHSARLNFKRVMELKTQKADIVGIMLLYNNMITNLKDLLDDQGKQSLYVLCMTADEKMLVRQAYTIDEAGKLVLGERIVLDHDPEETFLDHGFLAEQAVSMPDEMFAKVSKEILDDSFPKEWLDYIHRERKNRDEDEWYSPKRATASITDKKEGGHDEVPAAEETV